MSITTPTRITTQYAGLVADTSGHDDERRPSTTPSRRLAWSSPCSWGTRSPP